MCCDERWITVHLYTPFHYNSIASICAITNWNFHLILSGFLRTYNIYINHTKNDIIWFEMNHTHTQNDERWKIATVIFIMLNDDSWSLFYFHLAFETIKKESSSFNMNRISVGYCNVTLMYTTYLPVHRIRKKN